MAAGVTLPAAAAQAANPLLAAKRLSPWLCSPDAGTAADSPGGAHHAAPAKCHWCQAFGAGATGQPHPPEASPARAPLLLNQAFAAASARVLSLRTVAFQSRAPPLPALA